MLRWAAFPAYIALVAALWAAFTRAVPYAYMDEVFHVPQAQAYCAGRWSDWDDKITTFPGLYVCSAIVTRAARTLGAFSAETACSLASLRALNLVPALGSPPLLYALLRALHPSAKLSSSDLAMNAAVLSLFPMHFFFHFLYYTDSAATCSVLLLLLLATRLVQTAPSRSRDLASPAAVSVALGSCAALAIGFRQTNAVWVAFAVASAGLRRCHASGILDADAPIQRALRECLGKREPYSCLFSLCRRELLLSLGVLIAFAAFVRVNGSIVLGDKANHQPAFHTAQLLYAVAAASAPFALRTMSMGLPSAFLRMVLTRPLGSAVSVGAAMALARGTLCHPFLLADNRHLTFYLWRHLLGRHCARARCVVCVCVGSRCIQFRGERSQRGSACFDVPCRSCVLLMHARAGVPGPFLPASRLCALSAHRGHTIRARAGACDARGAPPPRHTLDPRGADHPWPARLRCPRPHPRTADGDALPHVACAASEAARAAAARACRMGAATGRLRLRERRRHRHLPAASICVGRRHGSALHVVSRGSITIPRSLPSVRGM